MDKLGTKLLRIYDKVTDTRSLVAFKILLESIDYEYKYNLIEIILSYASEDEYQFLYDILAIGKMPKHNKSKMFVPDVEFIFFSLFEEHIPISSKIKFNVCKKLECKYDREWFSQLCDAYFLAVRINFIYILNKMYIEEAKEWLYNHLKYNKERKEIYPRYSSSNAWNQIIPRYIKSIPMGGKNKKF